MFSTITDGKITMMVFSGIFVAVIVFSFTILVTAGEHHKEPFPPENRIIGGKFAEEGQFPYYVRVVCYGGPWSETRQFRCGGSIIDPKWVLTAGHCYLPTTNASEPITYHIEAGSIRSGEPRQFDIVINDNAFLHPGYNSSTLENDIALLKTKRWTFDDYVCPIRIALGSWTVDSYVGEIVTAMGFGYISNDGPVSEELRWTRLVVITREECNPYYENEVPESAFCAKDKKNTPQQQSICSGDSGGPIVLKRNGKLVQIGLVSFASDEGCLVAPGGHTNVAMFHDWITLTMAQN